MDLSLAPWEERARLKLREADWSGTEALHGEAH